MTTYLFFAAVATSLAQSGESGPDSDASTPQGKPDRSFRQKLPRFLLGALVLCVGGYYGYREYQFASTHESTDNAQVEAHLVPVLARVAGYVQSVRVADYDTVHPGELLVKIDPTEYQLSLEEQKADYQQSVRDIANARAALQNARVALGVTHANQTLQQIRTDKAKADLQRDSKLWADHAITRKQYDDTENNFATNVQQLTVASKQLALDDSRIPVQETALEKMESILAVKQARIAQQQFKLDNTNVFAPESGRIGKKTVEPGQYVQPGQTLLTIAGDQNYWIVANFKETQIRQMYVGQPAEIELDAYPGKIIAGHVVSLSEATGARFALLPPDNATGNFVKVTQRVPVKISIDEPARYAHLLRAGLSANVDVKVR